MPIQCVGVIDCVLNEGEIFASVHVANLICYGHQLSDAYFIRGPDCGHLINMRHINAGKHPIRYIQNA